MEPELSFNLSGVNDPTQGGLNMNSYDLGQVASVNNNPAGTPTTGMPTGTVDPVSSGMNASGQQQGGMFGGEFWQNGGANMILGGVQVLGNLWSTYQQHKMAKDQMRFAREQWDTNLANQTQTYNTALRDKAQGAANYAGEAGDPNFVDDYVERNEL